MFQFEQPQYLWLLSLLPLFLGTALWREKQNQLRLSQLGNLHLIKHQIIDNQPNRKWKELLFFLLGLFFCVVAMSNPQWGASSDEKETTVNIDVLFVIDVSKSMLAEDITPNRLLRTRAFCEKILDNIQAERIGILAFAAEAQWIMPFSTDKIIAKTYFQNIDTEIITAQGTALGTSFDAIRKKRKKEGNRPLIALLITDGESHEEVSIDNLNGYLTNDNILLYVIGAGTQEGANIPENGSFKKDVSGNPIVTKLNEKLLKEIAEKAGGKFYYLSDNQSTIIEDISKNINSIGNPTSIFKKTAALQSRFQIFLFLGLICMAAVVFVKFNIGSKKNLGS